MAVCCLCRRGPPQSGWRGLCQLCLDRMAGFAVPSGGQGLYEYSDIVRDVVIAAKSRGDRSLLTGCWQIFSSPAQTLEAISWADCVAAVPPSFWTRVRGRIHLGSWLASKLAASHRKPWLQIDPPVFWRIRKQAMKSGRQRRGRTDDADVLNFRIRWRHGLQKRNNLRLLLVDDVITTGMTAAQVCSAIVRSRSATGGEIEVRVIALAQSAREAFADSSSLSQTLESPSVQA